MKKSSAGQHRRTSGLFYIQEASSMLPVAALFAEGNTPERVMDVAAAPGSKPRKLPPHE
jgi:16S rRNA (cytosine1407-C5)-methyltransferase